LTWSKKCIQVNDMTATAEVPPSTLENHDNIHTLGTGMVRFRFKAAGRNRPAALRTYRRDDRGKWIMTFEITGDIRHVSVEHAPVSQYLLVKVRGDYSAPTTLPTVEASNEVMIVPEGGKTINSKF